MLQMPLLLHYAIYSSLGTMIEYLTGKITQNSMDWLVMDVNGIGYLCHVTKNTIENMQTKIETEVFHYYE